MQDSKNITSNARFDEELEKHGIVVVRCTNCNANLYLKTEEVRPDEILCPLCAGINQEAAQNRAHKITPAPPKKDPRLLRLVLSGLHWLKN